MVTPNDTFPPSLDEIKSRLGNHAPECSLMGALLSSTPQDSGLV